MADVRELELESNLRELFRIRRTVLNMLRKRKYEVPEEMFDEVTEVNYADFKRKYTNADGAGVIDDLLTITLGLEADAENKIMVFFPEPAKLPLKAVAAMLERMEQSRCSRGIIVIKDKPTPSAKSLIQDPTPAGTVLEHFTRHELLIDITEHELVPRHTLLTAEEKKQLLDRYKLQESQLPRILITDPISRYFGLKKHDVVKIERESETAGRYITYRICL